MENMAQERATKQFYFVSGALWTLLLQFTYSYHMHMHLCVYVCMYVCVSERVFALSLQLSSGFLAPV